MTAQAAPIERRAARVLLVDDHDRVLLFEGIDPHVPDVRFWFTPGGGVEGDESLEDAARRELREETGCEALLGPAVWTRTGTFSFLGRTYRQSEVFFLARVSAWEVDTGGFDAQEQDSVQGHRWWSVEELLASDALVYPRQLAARLAELLDAGPAAEPVDVGQ